MLTGPALGQAINQARIAKKMTKADLAREFSVKTPSVQGWIQSGRIDKAKLFAMMQFFSNVVGPTHWGIETFDGVDPKLAGLAGNLERYRSKGLLEDQDIDLLQALADRLAGKK